MWQELQKVVSTAMTLVDVVTDVILLVQWHRESHKYWFIIGTCIVLVSDLVEGLGYWLNHGFLSGACHLLGFGIVYELLIWWGSADRDDDEFFVAKMLEGVLEAAPFLVLQIYVAVIEEDYTYFSIISLLAT